MNFSELYETEQLLNRKFLECKPEQTRYRTYLEINPNLNMHSIYSRRCSGKFIPEHFRIAFTRLRTSSHRLKIETGRWARLTRERRICKCGEGIGDEQHVLTSCKLSKPLRDVFGSDVVYPDFLDYASEKCEFKLLYDILKICE